MKEKVIEYLMQGGETTRIVAEILYKQLSSFPDIYAEFLYWFEHRTFVQENPITIDGYTAQSLFENFPLNEIGAFNALTDLRKNHDQMLEILQHGDQSVM